MTTKPYFMGSEAQFRMFLSAHMGDEILQLVGFLEERAGSLWRSERLEEAYRIGCLALQLLEFTEILDAGSLESLVQDCRSKLVHQQVKKPEICWEASVSKKPILH
jgi:hypothetical protein